MTTREVTSEFLPNTLTQSASEEIQRSHGEAVNCAERLIVFARYPEAGTSKTRLIPALGAEGAADLQRNMTRHALAWASELARQRAVQVEVYYEGGDHRLMQSSFGAEFFYRAQCDGDLGQRLNRAFEIAFSDEIERAVIVGADCPGISCNLVETALDKLQAVDLVLGPAIDGGYYLIGLRQPVPELFRNISWGSGNVLDETLAAARAARVSFSLLTLLADVDRPEDLEVWHRAHNSLTLD